MKIFIYLLMSLIFLTGCSSSQIATPKNDDTYTADNEFRGVWISYYEIDGMLSGADEQKFTSDIDIAFGKIAAMELNTVIVHARANGDAYYNSSIFPKAQSMQSIDYDPLKIMLKSAQKHGLKVHAWINPYRISGSKPLSELDDNSIANIILNDDDANNDSAVIALESGVYFDPANFYANELIVNGVKEIVKNYDIDGIHFDDYFYPVTDESFDKQSYSDYTFKTAQPMSLADFRRDNVNKLIKSVYSAIKDLDKTVEFGISPMYNIEMNYNNYYADVQMWLKGEDYADYICPQLYFGYKHKTADFKSILEVWGSLEKSSSVKLYAGLAPYKIGTDDELSLNEWCTDTDILKNQVNDIRGHNKYSGFVFYSYSSLFSFDKLNLQQRNNLLSVIG